MSVRRHEVIPLLLEAAPGIADVWKEHRAFWSKAARSDYNDAMTFARYVVDSLVAGRTSELPAIFAVIERIVAEGNPAARELATIGVLEDVQSFASHEPFGMAGFHEWLHPRSRAEWDRLDALWAAGGGSLAGVLRLEASMGVRQKHKPKLRGKNKKRWNR